MCKMCVFRCSQHCVKEGGGQMAELLKVKLATACRKMRCNRPDTLAVIRIFSDPEICVVFFFLLRYSQGKCTFQGMYSVFLGRCFLCKRSLFGAEFFPGFSSVKQSY